MPELPEVETIVRDLGRMMVPSTILSADVRRPDLIVGDPDEFAAHLKNREVGDISRRAKNIVFDLKTGFLVVNLGMTGRLMVRDRSEPDDQYTGVLFPLSDGRKLVYRDVRRFGSLQVYSPAEWSERADGLGIEPLSDEFTAGYLHQLSRKSRVAIKTWLMDQRRVVGVGNIYASEALFRAGISPRKAAGRITRAEAARLVDSIRGVLTEAIEFRGTTFLDYRDASGESGRFVDRLAVYGRDGEPCRVCEKPIRRIVQGGRSTFYCTACQRS